MTTAAFQQDIDDLAQTAGLNDIPQADCRSDPVWGSYDWYKPQIRIQKGHFFLVSSIDSVRHVERLRGFAARQVAGLSLAQNYPWWFQWRFGQISLSNNAITLTGGLLAASSFLLSHRLISRLTPRRSIQYGTGLLGGITAVCHLPLLTKLFLDVRGAQLQHQTVFTRK